MKSNRLFVVVLFSQTSISNPLPPYLFLWVIFTCVSFNSGLVELFLVCFSSLCC